MNPYKPDSSYKEHDLQREIDERDMEIAKLRMELTLVCVRNTKLVIELDELKSKAALADRVLLACKDNT